MSDERGRGAADDERPHGDADPTEPEFGSSEWLLQQLTGGRHTERTAEPATAAVSADDEDRDAATTQQPPAPSPEHGGFDDLLAASAEPMEAEEPAAAEMPVSFSWNLTPGKDADPAVDADAPQVEEAAARPDRDAAEPEPVSVAPAAVVPEPVTPAPAAPEAATPAPEIPAPVEPGPVAAVPFVPERATPPAPEPTRSAPATTEPSRPDSETAASPTTDIPLAAGSWVIEREPTPPAEPAPPRSIFDPPPAGPEESHGLAALLGFGGPAGDAPSARSVIGDTTSIIPIDPAALTRPPAGAPVPNPVGPAPGPAAPVLPPIDAAALMESPIEPATPRDRTAATDGRQDAADVPTRQLDAAELAELLRADPVTPEPALPSQPTIPAAEAEVALGAAPSPATSPIDAESIAAASTPLTPPAVAAQHDVGLDDAGRLDADPDVAVPGESDDGLAALFGDVAAVPVEDDLAHSDAEEEAEPAQPAEPEAHAAVPWWSARRAGPESREQPGQESRTEPEPAADLEGPQLPSTATLSTATAAPQAPPEEPRTGGHAPSAPGGAGGLWDSRNNRILLLVLSALAVVLVLIGLFALGTRIPSLLGASQPVPKTTTSSTAGAATPSPTPTPTPTPAPTVTPKPAAAIGPGTHAWNTLGGGECIQPFTTVWAEEFTVVDCTTPHTAQLVYTNLVSADPAAPYPGADALAQQIPGLCSAGGVVDLKAAGAYNDLQVVGSFPATDQQWKSGQRSYYCFANRASGQPLTSSVAGPGPS